MSQIIKNISEEMRKNNFCPYPIIYNIYTLRNTPTVILKTMSECVSRWINLYIM